MVFGIIRPPYRFTDFEMIPMHLCEYTSLTDMYNVSVKPHARKALAGLSSNGKGLGYRLGIGLGIGWRTIRTNKLMTIQTCIGDGIGFEAAPTG